MIRNVMKGEYIFSQVSAPATKDDRDIGFDLMDTLIEHQDECVGMAANMIGIYKNIIVVLLDDSDDVPLLMFNPHIIKTSGKYYTTKERCLSLDGERETKRYEKIKVEYEDHMFKKRIKTFEGFAAQIIQHEIDHCRGIVI